MKVNDPISIVTYRADFQYGYDNILEWTAHVSVSTNEHLIDHVALLVEADARWKLVPVLELPSTLTISHKDSHQVTAGVKGSLTGFEPSLAYQFGRAVEYGPTEVTRFARTAYNWEVCTLLICMDSALR